MTDNSMFSRRALPDEVGCIGDLRWYKFEEVVQMEVALASGELVAKFYIPDDTTVEDLYLTVRGQTGNRPASDFKLIYDQQYLEEDQTLLYQVFPCKQTRVFFLTLVLSLSA